MKINFKTLLNSQWLPVIMHVYPTPTNANSTNSVVWTPAKFFALNPLKPELNSICYLLALLAHHFLHVCRIRVKSLTFRRLMSYIYIWSTHS